MGTEPENETRQEPVGAARSEFAPNMIVTWHYGRESGVGRVIKTSARGLRLQELGSKTGQLLLAHVPWDAVIHEVPNRRGLCGLLTCIVVEERAEYATPEWTVNRIVDQNCLLEIVLAHGAKDELRIAALQRLPTSASQEILECLCAPDVAQNVALAFIERANQQDLFEIGVHSTHRGMARTAVRRITDRELLKRLVCFVCEHTQAWNQHERPAVIAFEHLGDCTQAELQYLLEYARDPFVRIRVQNALEQRRRK